MRSRHVRVGGLDVRIATQEGDGVPLLLITGIGANVDMWEPFARALPGHRMVAFDAPGTGRSSLPRRPMRMRALAAHVVALLDLLGLERVDVLGYSWGGGLTQELAHREPSRVRRLVLCATSVGIGSVPPRPLAALVLATPARYYHPALFRATVPYIAGGRTAREPDLVAGQGAARLAHPPSLRGYAYQLYAGVGFSSLPWLHRLRQPTLVMAGDDDPTVPLINARLLAHRIPNARLHVVRGGGHLFLLDQPEQSIPAIRAFLDAP
jgi:poly(3-hydroxyalkanoate) depolymerase